MVNQGHAESETEGDENPTFVLVNPTPDASLASDADEDAERAERRARLTAGSRHTEGSRVKSAPCRRSRSPLNGTRESVNMGNLTADEFSDQQSVDGLGSSYERLDRHASVATLTELYECSTLCHTKRKLLPLKHYHDEARAMKDIHKFLASPVILFKLHHTTVHDIVEEMVWKLASEKPHLNINTEKIRNCIVEDNSDNKLIDIMQGIARDEQGAPETEQAFITILCNTNEVSENQVVMCLLHNPVNLGPGAEEVHFICLVISPIKEKKIKSAVEVARTYSTLLADYKLRRRLLHAHDAKEFVHYLELEIHRIFTEQRNAMSDMMIHDTVPDVKTEKWCLGRDLFRDVKRRIAFYPSDFTEGIKSCASIQKIISTICFLYFALMMPCIAFGVLDYVNTHGKIDVRKVVLSQAFSGLIFALVGGQPLIIVRTTVPVAIYIKVIYVISSEYNMDFSTFYALTGLWNCAFLIIYSFTGVSKLMKYCSRSTEEIFGLFISIAFCVDAIKFLVHEFELDFCFNIENDCNAAKALVSLILTFGTVFIGSEIYNFRYSPYLTSAKRVLVADYALPTAVLLMSFCGSYFFKSVKLETFTDDSPQLFKFTPFVGITIAMVLASLGLGFALSVLVFMDQNIASSIVNSPRNRLRKGSAYHLDLLVVAIINAVLSVFGLPWIHGALPHSPLHVRALADIEEHMDHGHLKEIVVYVRETRLTTVIVSVLIALSLLMLPSPLNYIPIPVLYGMFLFLAITALSDFQLWERMLLIFTEQNSYPPTHYIRKVPQRMVHFFTFLQLIQLAVLCGFSFAGSPYLKMLFPVLLASMLPLRAKIIPKLIPKRYLDALDGHF